MDTSSSATMAYSSPQKSQSKLDQDTLKLLISKQIKNKLDEQRKKTKQAPKIASTVRPTIFGGLPGSGSNASFHSSMGGS